MRQQDRDHIAERLRQNHQPHRLAVSESQCVRRVNLPLGDRLDAGAHDLAKICGLEHDEGDDRGSLGADLHGALGTRSPLQDLRHQEEKPEDHQHQGDRAHQVDIARGEHRQGLDRGKPRQSEQRAEEKPPERGDHGELHRVLKTLPQIR